MQKNLLSLLATSVHYIRWWTASREAYSRRAELTPGLSVGMSLCAYLPMFVGIFYTRGVCRANQQLGADSGFLNGDSVTSQRLRSATSSDIN